MNTGQSSSPEHNQGSSQGHQRPYAASLPAYDTSQLDSRHHSLDYLEGPAPGQPLPGVGDSDLPEPSRYFSGIASNAATLGISRADLLRSDAQSAFASLVSATEDHSHLPPSLAPTVIQHRYHHHPFFDCIPIPTFRDRAILAAASNPPLVNRFDLCYDMFAGGLLWRHDPTVESNWFFSGDFTAKWQALLEFDIAELQRRADSSI